MSPTLTERRHTFRSLPSKTRRAGTATESYADPNEALSRESSHGARSPSTVWRVQGVQQKIDHARLHAETLSKSVSEWMVRSPPSATPEYLPDRRGYRLILQPFVEAPPLEQWALLVGDCVHNLRSALDNLAFALALRRHDPPADPKGIYFPVFDDAKEFSARAGRTLGQLPEDAVQLLTAFQPFNRAAEQVKRDALLLLHHLDTHDKHRLPQIVLLAVNQRDHVAHLEFASEAEATAAMPPEGSVNGAAIQPGDSLMEIRVKRPIARLGGNVTVEAVPAIYTLVALEGVIPTLEALGRHVSEILTRCRALPSVTSVRPEAPR